MLLIVALIVGGVHPLHQRLDAAGLGAAARQGLRTVNAELPTAQAVTPGQGQTVNIAGVEVGQISSVELEDGKAVIGMNIEREYTHASTANATVLLRPKTGLKDMVAELDPGTEDAGELPEGEPIPVSQTLPDVNLDEILASLDADTRDYLRVLLGEGSTALNDNGRQLAQTIRRFEPTAKYTRKVNEQLAKRRHNIKRVVHNFSPADRGARQQGPAARRLRRTLERRVLARWRARTRTCGRRWRSCPARSTRRRRRSPRSTGSRRCSGPTWRTCGPAPARSARRCAGDAAVPDKTTPILKNQIRPFTRAALPTVKEPRPALEDLAAVTPNLTRSFKVVNVLLNTLAYNPPGSASEGYLFWLSWLNHVGSTVFSTQDAHGPIRHGLVVLSCSTAQLLALSRLDEPAARHARRAPERPERRSRSVRSVRAGA